MSSPTLESGSRRSVRRPDLEFRADVGPHTRVWIPEECAETRSGVQSRCRAPHLSLDAGVCGDQIWSLEQMFGPTLESGSRRSVRRPDLEFRADVGPHT